jgi:hypothetical protein
VTTWSPNGEEDGLALASLKERMVNTLEPSERAISTCPQGTWLDGLRESFEPEAGSGRDSK